MKKTQRIDLLTTIRESIVSFFAITMFVALGAGLFLGIHWVEGAMHEMAGAQFEQGNAHDVEILFPYGLTDDDLARLAELEPGDLDVEAGYVAFENAKQKSGDGTYAMRVGTLPARIDTFTAVEGTLPQAPNEIALEATTAAKYGYGLGDTVSFASHEQGIPYLAGSSFKVVALVTSPAYLSTNASTYGASTSGSVAAMGWVAPEAFNDLIYLGGKPYVLVRSARLRTMDPFGDEYRTSVAELTRRVSALGQELGTQRMRDIHTLGGIVASSGELTSVSVQVEDLELRYANGKIDDAGYQAERAKLIARVRKALESAGVDMGQMPQDELDMFALVAGTAFSVLGEEATDALREQFSSVVDYSWIVLSRSYNGAVLLLDGFCNVTSNLRWTMASLFVVVGILVCYSSLSRIVHEHTTRIGTKKALGFFAKEVNALFLSYATICVVVGMVAGVVGGVYVVENILVRMLGSRFVPNVALYANVVDVALMGCLELALILGATWLAVAGVLKRQAVDLLAGGGAQGSKEHFYERWGIWKRMGMLAQVTVNNCVSDRRRVVGTLVGVAGCTALIACAITLNDNVQRSLDVQYEDVAHYDVVANVGAESKAAEGGVAALSAAGMEASAVFQRSLTLYQPDGSISTATISVPMDEGFDKLMSLNSSDSGTLDPKQGVLVSEAYRDHLGAKVGDKLKLVDITGNSCELPIAGFFEWHLLSHQVIVPESLYQKEFGIAPRANRLLVNTGGKGVAGVDAALSELGGYQGAHDDRDANKGAFNELSRIARIVVLVYLGLAVVMAGCVLLNLDFMFVDEKKRELIVLMICGFSLKDAKGYVWHDSVVLTALGIVCGLVLGGAVGSATVRSIELANTSFLHGVSWFAMGVAAAGTAVMAAIALLIALRRIGRFELTDINRF